MAARIATARIDRLNAGPLLFGSSAGDLPALSHGENGALRAFVTSEQGGAAVGTSSSVSESPGGPWRPTADRNVCPVSWAKAGPVVTVVACYGLVVETARCRCYGHAEGTAGEDPPATAWWRRLPARPEGEAHPRQPLASLARVRRARGSCVRAARGHAADWSYSFRYRQSQKLRSSAQLRHNPCTTGTSPTS
jgi:hypothetical protein